MYPLEEIKEFQKELNVYNVITNSEIHDKFIAMYSYTFEQHPGCSGCADDVEQAINKFNWIVKKHNGKTHLMKADKLSKYTMKPKVRIYSSALNMMVTQFNCTDAIAEVLIKENPNVIASFILNINEEPKAIETYSVSNPVEEKQVVKKPKAAKKKKVA